MKEILLSFWKQVLIPVLVFALISFGLAFLIGGAFHLTPKQVLFGIDN